MVSATARKQKADVYFGALAENNCRSRGLGNLRETSPYCSFVCGNKPSPGGNKPDTLFYHLAQRVSND